MDRLKEIKERAAKATPGPWRAEGSFIFDENHSGWWPPLVEVHKNAGNAEFVAHSREDIPHLIRRLEETEKALEAARKALDAVR